jgi:hypothetical protein
MHDACPCTPFQIDFIEDIVAPSQIFRALILYSERKQPFIQPVWYIVPYKKRKWSKTIEKKSKILPFMILKLTRRVDRFKLIYVNSYPLLLIYCSL